MNGDHSFGGPGLHIRADDPTGVIARMLIDALCREMAERYGTPPSPFSPTEGAVPKSAFRVAWLGDQAVGCGALRPLEGNTAEIKRMYVAPAGRRRGIARRILLELEGCAQEFGYRTIRLETGVRQPEAQALYEAMGYGRIPAFGTYAGNPTSVCFEKEVGQGG